MDSGRKNVGLAVYCFEVLFKRFEQAGVDEVMLGRGNTNRVSYKATSLLPPLLLQLPFYMTETELKRGCFFLFVACYATIAILDRRERGKRVKEVYFPPNVRSVGNVKKRGSMEKGSNPIIPSWMVMIVFRCVLASL